MNKWQKIYCDTYYNGKYPRSKEGKNAMKLLKQIKDKVLVDKPDFRGLHGFNPAHVEILTVTDKAEDNVPNGIINVSTLVANLQLWLFRGYDIRSYKDILPGGVYNMTIEKATKIAEEFLKKVNPDMWDGTGEKPESVNDTAIKRYDLSKYNYLDISIEYNEEDKCWNHCCEIVDKEDDMMSEILSGYGIDSKLNLIDTILDLCGGVEEQTIVENRIL